MVWGGEGASFNSNNNNNNKTTRLLTSVRRDLYESGAEEKDGDDDNYWQLLPVPSISDTIPNYWHISTN